MYGWPFCFGVIPTHVVLLHCMITMRECSSRGHVGSCVLWFVRFSSLNSLKCIRRCICKDKLF